MVYYALLVGAELDGLTNLQPSGGCDDPSFPYYLKLKCENCGEVTAKSTYVTLSEQVDLPKGHGTAHLVQKCKLCGRDGTIVMIPGQGTPLTIEQSQKEEKTCLMVFDCRGYEPVEFSFGAGWKAESVHGTPFEIDCSEDEFSEYDEKGECPVELSKLQSTFKVVKKHEKGGKTRFV
ncbi:UPF0587 protein F46B6.12 [Zea mays]|uniref:Uncharacterized protein n=3 Tax=Zea mays TaxID=4577 RepID=B6TIH4_MAIZE|nr:uncharacterized protein LOC100276801 [Zea mays]ACG36907.1 hypothetical protein [Zea mays]ACG48866.1 hypothetical protein [Zea mays]ONM40508.1 hypothetical protein ZEAMMB73_Zm00001d044226 [Zea mays]PWZ32648.1 UPF0587 protein F46B6.12 [Zea mays]|eukprot:NP_001143983.1 uncharacterized protein LOC100276801 [Zea mays]